MQSYSYFSIFYFTKYIVWCKDRLANFSYVISLACFILQAIGLVRFELHAPLIISPTVILTAKIARTL